MTQDQGVPTAKSVARPVLRGAFVIWLRNSEVEDGANQSALRIIAADRLVVEDPVKPLRPQRLGCVR